MRGEINATARVKKSALFTKVSQSPSSPIKPTAGAAAAHHLLTAKYLLLCLFAGCCHCVCASAAPAPPFNATLKKRSRYHESSKHHYCSGFACLPVPCARGADTSNARSHQVGQRPARKSRQADCRCA